MKKLTIHFLWTLSLAIALTGLSGCATSTTAASNVTQKYVVRQVGTTTYLEPMPELGARAVAGAILGTGIAAGLQSKPIPLKKGTDFACQYKDIINAKLDGCD